MSADAAYLVNKMNLQDGEPHYCEKEIALFLDQPTREIVDEFSDHLSHLRQAIYNFYDAALPVYRLIRKKFQ